MLHINGQLKSYLFIISSGSGFWLVNHTSVYENIELNVFKIIKLFGEISNNWLKHLLERNASKSLNSCYKSLLTIITMD